MLEPYSCQRDVAYIVVAPENDLVLNNVKMFFKEFSAVYEVWMSENKYFVYCLVSTNVFQTLCWQTRLKFRSFPVYLPMLVLAKETSRRSQVFCSTVHPHFTDTRLIRTPHYYRQFALSLGKESLHIFSIYSTCLIWTPC